MLPPHRATILLLAVSAILLFPSGSVQAQQSRIGGASVARNDVRGNLASGTVVINAGDGVFRDEGIRTGPDSEAKMVFLDSTNLAIGPSANVKLDKFVYSGDASAQEISFNLAKGVFRFTTGKADKSAYKISTPVATIGVRGTQLDIAVISGRSTVTLIEGEAIVCHRQSKRRCLVISRPGDQVVVTASGANQGSGQPSFQAYCAVAGLCEASNYDASSQYAGGGALCGH
jgi:hypothetical protein